MSAIAGLYRVDGRPADPGLLTRMLERLASRGPHAESRWVNGPVGLAHRLLHTTPESLKERQPVSDAWGECRLIWDGRVDNRDTLIADLRKEGLALDAATDPDLVLQAYRAWGTACFSRIVGDFAFALWDGRFRRLLCVRDSIGVKPLYYHWDGRRVLFASEIKALLEDPTLVRRPNEPMIADYLLMGFRDPEATFFDGVKQVRPGHLLRVEQGAVSVERYWDFDPARAPRYADDFECLDRFRTLFREAVRCRLRSPQPLGILLSGGIDSTGVAAMAAHLRRDTPALPPLRAFTLLLEEYSQEERDAVHALADVYGTPVHWIRQENAGFPLTTFEVHLTDTETLHYNSFLTLPPLLKPASASGATVLLTGFGADELSRVGEYGYLQDLLRAGRLGRLRADIRAIARVYDDSQSAVLRELVRRLVPGPLKHRLKALGRSRVPPWIAPSFARHIDLAARTMPEGPRKWPTLCQEESYRALVAPSMSLSLAWMDAACSAFSTECRHPFLDRRLIEFFLSIPPEVKMRSGYRKMFFQHAIQGVSPAPVRPAERPAACVPPMAAGEWRKRDAVRLRQDLLHPDALVYQYQYLSRAATETIQDRYLAGKERHRNLLWQFGNLERWLREYFPAGAA